MKKGEFLSLIGKSGSGKSTLLYVLSTMGTDFTGELSIIGKNLIEQCVRSLTNEHIGFVFQFPCLLPEFSAIDNVMLPALKLGKKCKEEIRANTLEKLILLDIRDQVEKLVNKLSGGGATKSCHSKSPDY